MVKLFYIVLSIFLTLLVALTFVILAKQASIPPSQHTPSTESPNQPDKEKPNSNDQDDNDQKPDKGQENKIKTYWGVDSAAKVNTSLYQCVADTYGEPDFWARYTETKENVSFGLTDKEISFLHNKDAKILLIYNHFTDATGYDKGVSEAKQAISNAGKLGTPKNVAVFADIEPSYPVDGDFIRGYVQQFSSSKYKPGIYGVFSDGNDLSKAFQNAVSKDSKVSDQAIVWSSSPQPGITTKANAPAFNPTAPKGSNDDVWQYGQSGKKCDSPIDTDLIQSKSTQFIW